MNFKSTFMAISVSLAPIACGGVDDSAGVDQINIDGIDEESTRQAVNGPSSSGGSSYGSCNSGQWAAAREHCAEYHRAFHVTSCSYNGSSGYVVYNYEYNQSPYAAY